MKRRVFSTAIIVALAASFILNWFLYREVRRWYRNFNLVRLSPLALGAYSEDEEQIEEEKPRVVYFGDSRAYAWSPPAGLEQFTFVNRGVQAHTTQQCLLRFDAHVAPLEPDILVVQVGVNDLVAIPLLPSEKAEIVADTSRTIRQIVEKAQAIDATVVLTTVFPAGPTPLLRVPFWSKEVNLAIEEVNADLRTLAGDGVIILETAPVLAADNGLVRAEYARDHLHLSEEGYAALNVVLARTLSEIRIEALR